MEYIVRKITRESAPPFESAQPSSHGIPPTELETGGFGDEVPLTKSSKFISPPLVPFVSNALPFSRVWLYVLVCCSIRLTSRRCLACSSSTLEPRVLMTLFVSKCNDEDRLHSLHEFGKLVCVEHWQSARLLENSRRTYEVPLTWPIVEAGPMSLQLPDRLWIPWLHEPPG